MQSIIVEISVPATSSSFDFRLPSTGRIGDIVNEIVRILEGTQQNLLFNKEQIMLCDCENRLMLKNGDTVAEAGLQDGARLMLV